VTCFDDAKVTIQYICPAKRELEIVSLHEIHPDVLSSVHEKLYAKSFLVSDPENRCAIALVRDAFFMVIPIPERLGPEFFDEVEESGDQANAPRKPKPKITNYEVKLHDIDKRLHDVSDFIILSNQYIPTAVLLYEPKKNSSGRAAIEYDCFCVAAVSFDLKERQTTVTWEIQGFPMSLQKMIHIPEPVNGILLCGTNELIYAHQSAPTYGVSLNSNNCGYSKFSLHEANVCTALDGVVVGILSPYEILIGSRDGELYVATIDTDAMNSVRSISLQKVIDIPIPSSIINLSRGYVYIGSKINNCALLKYKKHSSSKILPSVEEMKQDPIDNLDMLNGYDPLSEDYQKIVSHYFYGETDEEIAMLEAPIKEQQYNFSLIQSLLNTAPFKRVVPCIAEEMDDTFKDSVRDQVFDLAVATGQERDGKLLFMERTVRPHIGTSVPLKAPVACTFAAGKFEDAHRYIFLTREMDTVVLDTTKNLSGHHTTPFNTNEGTVVAGDLLDGVVVCQITIKKIILVKDHKACLEMPLDADSDVYVVDAAICDPFIAVTLSSNKLYVARITVNSNGEVSLNELASPHIPEVSEMKTTCLTLYCDRSGLFVKRKSDNSNALIRPVVISENSEVDMEDDYEDYGDEISRQFYASRKQESNRESNVVKNRRLRTTVIDYEFDNWQPDIESCLVPPTVSQNYFLILAKEDGALYFFSIPDFELVFVSPQTNSLWTTLVDDPKFGNYNPSLGFIPPEANQKRQRPMVHEGLRTIQASRICEVAIFGTGPNGCRPILGVLVDDTVTLFEAFPFDNYLDGHLMIRFKRLDKQIFVRRNPFVVDDKKAPIETITIGVKIRVRYLNFDPQLGTMSNAIVITGGYPTIVYVGSNGTFYHPLSIDGPIVAFCHLTTSSIINGFVYVKENVLRIGELPLRYPRVDYDTPYPCRAINMGCNINHMSYLLPFNLFALDVSASEEYNSIWSVNNDELVEQKISVPERFVLPKKQKHKLKLYTRENYNFTPYNDVEFKEFESVTALEEVLISTLGSKTGKMNYIAVGTSFNMGEEVPMRGRLIVYEIIEVVPEANMPTSRFRLKILAEAEEKGPISAIASTEGVMLVGVGPRIYLYTIKDEGLIARAFLDLQFYVTQIYPFKSLALTTDMFTSVHMIRYQEEFNVLSEIAFDDRKICPRVSRTGYIINNDKIAIVLGDFEGNLLVLEHAPESKESKFAQRLLIKGGIRIGNVVTNFIRAACHVGDSMVTQSRQAQLPQMCLYTTKEGAWGYVRPVPEKSYRKLFMLQHFIENQLQQLGGLNSKGARIVRPNTTGTEVNYSSAKQLVDADLMMQFLQLDSHDMEEISRRLGSSKYQMLDDLIELIRTSKHF